MILLNILLSTLLLSLILTFKRSSTILCCGIFGFSGRDGKKADPRKLLILGLYNRTRGVDSCGYYYNGNIVKGIEKEADFKDFVVNNKFTPGDLPFETFMGHTRKSTYGSHTLENAHPHKVENYVQTHNGTIKNIWSLCGKYDVNHININVDSIALAHIIQKSGFKVLNEYEGHAALTMVFMDDPQSLYLYHGASRDKEDVKTVWEERPLFTLETAEGLYYSSMEESLLIINTNKKVKPQVLSHNQVFLVQNGQIIKNVYTVKREEMNIPKNYNHYSGDYWNPHKITQKQLSFKKNESTTVSEDGSSVLFTESKPMEYINNDVYFRYGRFFTTATFASEKTYSSIEVLLHGEYRIDRGGNILEKGESSSKVAETFYFIRGIMMIDKYAYEKCLRDNKNILTETVGNIAYTLSKYSRYPVTMIVGEGTGVSPSLKYIWYENEKRYTGTITPKFTKRRYDIKEGRLHNIVPGYKNEQVYCTETLEEKDFGVDRKPLKKDDELNENDLYDYIVEIIDEWSDKILTIEDLPSIPEVFLIYIEHFNKHYEKPNVTDTEKLAELAMVLRDLIQTKQTFLEYTKSLFEPTWIKDINNIQACFGDLSSDDILALENRYKKLNIFDEIEEAEVVEEGECCTAPTSKEQVIDDFNELVEKENYKLFEKKFEAKLEELTSIADDFQSLSGDDAQQRAFKLYKAIQDLKLTEK